MYRPTRKNQGCPKTCARFLHPAYIGYIEYIGTSNVINICIHGVKCTMATNRDLW